LHVASSLESQCPEQVLQPLPRQKQIDGVGAEEVEERLPGTSLSRTIAASPDVAPWPRSGRCSRQEVTAMQLGATEWLVGHSVRQATGGSPPNVHTKPANRSQAAALV